MVVRLRLARHGTRNNPFYHVVVIRDSKARDARPIEKVGEYDPIPRIQTVPKQVPRLPKAFVKPGSSSNNAKESASSKASTIPGHGALMTSGLPPSALSSRAPVTPAKRLEWNESRIKYWLSVGVQPSKPVARLLNRAGLVPPGVHYKGIYRPPVDNYPAPNVTLDTNVKSQPSPKQASPKP